MKKLIILALLLSTSFCAFSQRYFYRYYNPKTQKHFYTADQNELGNGAVGFNLEGVTCWVYGNPDKVPGLKPIFRFFNSTSGDHYFTTKKFIPAQNLNGYVMEKIAGYIFTAQMPGTVPLYEYYNAQNADHFYTIDPKELGRGFEGYVLEGVIGYVYPRDTRF